MNQELWQRASELFLRALEIDDNERQALIDSARAENPELATAVTELLAGHEDEGLIDALAADDGALGLFRDEIKSMAPAGIQPGDVVGAFEIVDKLGEGGMASVYRARRLTDEFHQEVALKILSSHQLSDEAQLRFTFERQIAASLDHPNIAKLIDGGVTEDGRPYFALELVEGEPIDAYCDRQELSVHERVQLVIDVAAAVHHAHRNLLVHRDLKPSNILVDTSGRVRLLDFGIAKPLDPDIAGSAQTQTGALLLTPRYSSPEQFVGTTITTASDQYQLGLLLFELVTGHCHHLLEGDDLGSMARRITDTDSPRPSRVMSSTTTASSASGERTLEQIARARQLAPDDLSRQLSGDLDTIILKTLEKDVARRYPSVEAVAEDLQRYLNDEPVRAQPQSLRYRAQKFSRRHRIAVAAAALALGALTAGAAIASWQAVRASRAETEALREAATAKQVSTFLTELFKVADPGATAGRNLTADEILERGRKRLTTDLQDQPVVRGRLLRTISRIYHHLGDFDRATELGQEALQVHSDSVGDDSLDVANDLYRLAETQARRSNFEEAQDLYQQSLDIRVALLGRQSQEAADSLAGIGRSVARLGRGKEGEEYQREALAIRLAQPEPASVKIAHSYYYLGSTLSQNGEYEEALEMLRKAAAIDRQVYGRESRDYAEDLNMIATVEWRLGRYRESITTTREKLSISQSLYGAEHYLALRGLEGLALNLIELAQYQEAEELIRRALAGKRKAFGERSQEAGGALHNLGYLLRDMGRFEEAETIYRQAIAIRAESMGPDHPRVAELRENLGETWVELGRLDEAEASFEQALRDKQAKLGADHPRMSWPYWGLGLARWRRGQLAQAQTALETARDLLERPLGPDHLDLAYSLHILANVKRDMGEYGSAEPLYRKALEMRSKTSPRRLIYRRTIEDFAELLRRADRPSEARDLLDQLPAH